MYFDNDTSYNNTPLNAINAWTLRDKGEKSFVFDSNAKQSSEAIEDEQKPEDLQNVETLVTHSYKNKKPFSKHSARLESSQKIEQIDDNNIKQWKV